ncbi:PREDICTED: uncharacterized protein LOC109234832 [Nicotiana attenuata]|uniref:uncharacterized protein LOC109234832 n=1 Tax=Nicotiana attenuata TaxID=49451 RepID=UPI000904B8D7|nr:PREDICTED: uncharacterized protein LOC109234832 [Nicotiana attenuata]
MMHLEVLHSSWISDVSETGGIEQNLQESTAHPSGNHPHQEVDKFEQLMKEANEELYPGCKKFSKLSFLLHMYRTKCMFKWSNESFNALLGLLKDALSEGEKLPPSFYETKKIVEGLGLKYEKIHACPNDCMLFRKELANKNVNKCKICGASRWKNDARKILAKVLRYFPLKPRLQRLFMSSETSKAMRWHHEERNKDGVLRHPADSEALKIFDSKYPEFAGDPRNVRLGLASDGLFGTMRTVHSTWPVILMPYNLPPWMCMKQEFFILSLVIPGPKAPGNNIEVFLQPLIEELNELWDIGVETYDASTKDIFQMRAALMWTINDFPAYGTLSGWCTYGRFACPSCDINTQSRRLRYGRKFCYMAHRRFLKSGHKYRNDAKSFDGTKESRPAPCPVSGSLVLNQVKDIKFTLGQSSEEVSGVTKNTWRKRSIFFDLPYWKSNLVRHNLDVMHIEKNVCDNLIYTLLDLGKKSKDNLEARLDLKEMKIRPSLWPQYRASGRPYLPPTFFTMSPNEKELFYEVLQNAKFPDGYASNISRCFCKRKIFGLKTHDCHFIMQELLPLALRRSVDKRVSSILIELCTFFRVLCIKELKLEELKLLEEKIPETLSTMEKLFLPGFFTVMIHLVIHLATEAKHAGPVHYRWMYPIERFLGTLKSYIRNHACPEGSIAEAYIANECMAFCSQYLEGGDSRSYCSKKCGDGIEHENSKEECLFPIVGESYGGVDVFELDEKTWLQAHRHVLFNYESEVVENYKKEHIAEIERSHRKHRLTQHQLDRAHFDIFHEWFKEQIKELEATSKILKDVKVLAQGLSYIAKRFTAFDVNNGYRFRTKQSEEFKVTQNSSVMVVSKTESYASTSDNAPKSANITYYGRLNDIVELNYYEEFKVVLFKCDWVVVTKGRGVKEDDLGFTLVNFSHLTDSGVRERHEPFIFAEQAQQVIFVQDPQDHFWFVPRLIKPRDIFNMGDENSLQFESSIQSDATDLALLENARVLEDEYNDWVRSGVDGIVIDTNAHSQASLNDGEANVEGGNDIENECDST